MANSGSGGTAQQFACRSCQTTCRIPESPTTGKQRVQKGCETCNRITEHLAVGRSVWAASLQFRASWAREQVSSGGSDR